jgi:hypothetical protein
MKYYKIQNRSQKNYHSCVPFNMSTYYIFSFLIFVLHAVHEPGYSWIGGGGWGIGGVLQHVGLIF